MHIYIIYRLQSKCEHYWPTEVGKSIEPAECGLRVTLSEQRPYAEYQVKTLLVTKVSKLLSLSRWLV